MRAGKENHDFMITYLETLVYTFGAFGYFYFPQLCNTLLSNC